MCFNNCSINHLYLYLQCRIMRDRSRTNADGKGKSQGFGFVGFTDHQHAMAALRHTNNNPDIFGDKKVRDNDIVVCYRLIR